jgi:aryl-alcohol dehydrogenase-like predicted oxidoreductase
MSGMLTRPLGSTGLHVTSLGLGLAAIGRPGYITVGRDADLGADRSVPTLRLRAHEVLDAAYAVGVRYFDVARSYGLAEEFLASWLEHRGLPADAVTVGSKWGYTYTAGWRVEASIHEVKDHSLGALRRQLAESRGVLGQRLQLYQVHSATLQSGVLESLPVLAELADLRQHGLAIGLSLSGPDQAEVARRALAVEVDGVNLFSCVQATWNLLETSVGSALAVDRRRPIRRRHHDAGSQQRRGGRDDPLRRGVGPARPPCRRPDPVLEFSPRDALDVGSGGWEAYSRSMSVTGMVRDLLDR